MNTDVGDDTDCDDDGTADVRITAKSENEVAGERVTLNCTVAGASCTSGEYRGSLPISATYDSPGVLFVQSQGTENPVIEVNYFDYDDGTGSVCLNSVDENAQGLVQAFTSVALTGGNVVVIANLTSDNGDGDPFADPGETIDMRLILANRTGVLLNGITSSSLSKAAASTVGAASAAAVQAPSFVAHRSTSTTTAFLAAGISDGKEQ